MSLSRASHSPVTYKHNTVLQSDPCIIEKSFFSCEDPALQVRLSVCPSVRLCVCGQPDIECPRMFKNESDNSRMFWTIPEYSRMFQNACRMFQNACRMFQRHAECFKGMQNVSKCMQHVQECMQKVPECMQNVSE